MGRDAAFAQVGHERGRVVPFASTQRQPQRRSGGMAMDHFQRHLTLGMNFGLLETALYDQPVAVLHQSMPR